MEKLCSFGKMVKIRLVEINQTQSWLERKVKEDTGLYIDRSYLHKILTGKAKPEKIISSIKKILEIEVEEERVG